MADNINDLAALLRQDGDKILDASSKLSLSAALLHKLNVSFSKLFRPKTEETFHVITTTNDSFLDLQFLYDFLQKTVGLKIVPGRVEQPVDINVFRNLKLLEIHRFSAGLIRGIKTLRTQLQYLTCVRSLGTLREVLEWCGGDRSHGFVWCELEEAVFSYNDISVLDRSLEFAPCLRTLDLSHNRIDNIKPLNCLSHLEFLNLSFNRLDSAQGFYGSVAERLQVLVLCNNYIEDIQELCHLVNLQKLDLSNNCLVEHSLLSPLSHLARLRWLSLQGNPVAFHPKHRKLTAKHLHSNAASCDFTLDGVRLSKSESRLAGSLHPPTMSMERSSSFNSTITASTVVRSDWNGNRGGSTVSVEDGNGNPSACPQEEMVGMQDSGFVAGPRPATPSECSIGSATSLDSTIVEDSQSLHGVRYYESDIEVLSNPSQSSIEVLSRGPMTHIRCVHSVDVIRTPTVRDQSTNVDLISEHHRSL